MTNKRKKVDKQNYPKKQAQPKKKPLSSNRFITNKNDNENSNVSIEIFYDEESIELELPLSINYSTELKTRLDLITGNHNIIIT